MTSALNRNSPAPAQARSDESAPDDGDLDISQDTAVGLIHGFELLDNAVEHPAIDDWKVLPA